MREDLRTFIQQEGPPDDCPHGIPENIECPECIDQRWRADYTELENEYEAEQDHSRYLERLLAALYGPGWEFLTIEAANKYRVLCSEALSVRTGI